MNNTENEVTGEGFALRVPTVESYHIAIARVHNAERKVAELEAQIDYMGKHLDELQLERGELIRTRMIAFTALRGAMHEHDAQERAVAGWYLQANKVIHD